ncbi:hypothetical protein AB6F61_11530 [Providencia hangzhouensis]
MLKQIAEEDNTLPKLYGIAELNNGQALNANYPFTMSEVAKALGHNSWHAVQNIIDQIEKEKGFDIKSNDNNYHITIMTGKTGFHKYSHLAVELMRKVISDEEYELNL